MYRVYLIHRRAFHWTPDFRRTVCGLSFNSRGYTEPSSVGSSDKVCPKCRNCAISDAARIVRDGKTPFMRRPVRTCGWCDGPCDGEFRCPRCFDGWIGLVPEDDHP
jgi:hypothetical protein